MAEPPVRLREAKKAFTHQWLIEAAVGVFDAKGYSAATVDDIVSAAGSTRATFYQHFGSKAAVATALLEHVHEELTPLRDALPGVIAVGGVDPVRAWLDDTLAFWERMRPQLRAITVAQVVDPSVAELADHGARFIRAIVDGFGTARRFTDDERFARAVLMYGHLQTFSDRFLERGWEVDRAVVLDAIVESWLSLGHLR